MIKFFLKLFKALNSSQTPWQMSLAVSMGMAMGLTPYSGIQTVVLIFLALIINIHIGLFLVSSTLFAGIAYLIDPYFEELGYMLLNMEALKEFFTAAYNSGLLRLTYFNNTIVLGSNVVAIVLILPMYFTLNKIVYLYRNNIALKLQQYTIFRKLGVEISDKKDKFFRVWGIALFVLLGGGIAVFGYLFMDKLLKSAIEDGLTKGLKKKVSIENLALSFSKGEINIDKLYIADDKKAILSTENINVDIDLNQLLFHRYHISNINFSGMAFNTEVKDRNLLYSKQIESSSAKETESQKKAEEAKEFKLPSLSMEEPQVLIDRVGLSSLKDYEATKEKINNLSKKYKDIINKDFSKEEIAAINSEIKEMQSKLASKDLKDIIKHKDEISDLSKKIKAKQELLAVTKKEFTKDQKSIKEDYKNLSKSATDDYNNLKSQYKFDSGGGVNVIGVLFGDKIKSYLGDALEYYEMAKPYLKSDEAKKEVAPPRGQGRWIRFKDNSMNADFLIKRINISGIMKEQSFKLLIEDVSSNQMLSKKPMTFSFVSDGDEFKELVAVGEDNHLDKKINTTSNYSLTQSRVKNIDLGFIKLDKSNYTLKGALNVDDYSDLNSQTTVLFSGVSLSLKQTDTKLMKSLLEVVGKIDNFDLNVRLGGTLGSPDVSVKSNLDQKISGAFSEMYKNEVARYQQKLKELIDNQIKEKLNDLGLHEKGFSDIDTLLSGENLGIDKLQSETQSIQNSLENKAKDKGKEKAKKLLKSFKL